MTNRDGESGNGSRVETPRTLTDEHLAHLCETDLASTTLLVELHRRIKDSRDDVEFALDDLDGLFVGPYALEHSFWVTVYGSDEGPWQGRWTNEQGDPDGLWTPAVMGTVPSRVQRPAFGAVAAQIQYSRDDNRGWDNHCISKVHTPTPYRSEARAAHLRLEEARGKVDELSSLTKTDIDDLQTIPAVLAAHIETLDKVINGAHDAWNRSSTLSSGVGAIWAGAGAQSFKSFTDDLHDDLGILEGKVKNLKTAHIDLGIAVKDVMGALVTLAEARQRKVLELGLHASELVDITTWKAAADKIYGAVVDAVVVQSESAKAKFDELGTSMEAQKVLTNCKGLDMTFRHSGGGALGEIQGTNRPVPTTSS